MEPGCCRALFLSLLILSCFLGFPPNILKDIVCISKFIYKFAAIYKQYNFQPINHPFTPMYDMFSNQVLTALHRYRDVKFSPPYFI